MDPEPKTSSQSRYLKDPVHDQILITPRMSEFIDSTPFQRLRRIKQLGTTYYVWAGASHNRFEHCIGVAHLARKMVTGLRKHQPKLDITDRDIECVTLAGLCHDLGHGPWSHVWDGMFIPAILPEERWTHEEGSEMMLDYLVKEKEIDIPTDDVAFIKALIAGDPQKCQPDEKLFLFDIVANKRNGLDVDKFDYIQRDSLAIGDSITLQINRLTKSARVIKGQICYQYKDLDKVLEVFQTRHKLHKNFYSHKTANAIEYMIVDGLQLAEPFMHLAERIRKPEEFLWLTDDLLPEIERSQDPNLKPAQDIFKRITNRKLYRFVDMKWVAWEDRDAYKQLVTEQRILECAREAYDELPKAQQETMNEAWKDAGLTLDDLTANDIQVQQSMLHYGMKEENPLKKVRFYSKAHPHKCHKARDGDYSSLRPLVFAEVLLRVFTKKEEFHGIIQAGYHRIQRDTPHNPGKAPETVAVEVAEGGRPIQVSDHTPRSTSDPFVPATARSSAPMSPPMTERGLPDDGPPTSQDSTDRASSRSLSKHASRRSLATIPDVEGPLSTAATAGSTSALPSPETSNTSPKYVTPYVPSSPHVPPLSKPLSSNSSNPRILLLNRFTAVSPSHGSPGKSTKPLSKKRDRSMVEAEDQSMSTTTRTTRSSVAILSGDRQVSPSPVARKQAKHG
ncbi:HD-domain/PDEase-like protein [Lentinula aciculospora]|uniref:HD-domain/PDEase-like protein n=1 Tax=Lentinula aciculospora TaxID=153920 RepID=A0A9W9A5L4_9AGAR|nr:HD-domain/PDEase-like protein [Lentinula aciculospora]